MLAQTFEARSEGNGTWLPLIEYSIRSGLSLSTIRRKIKSNTLRYRLEKGRYLVHFDGVPLAPQTLSSSKGALVAQDTSDRSEEPVENAVKMISEAFEHALREKDERIHLLEAANASLKERLNELKLLVRVLEEKYSVRY